MATPQHQPYSPDSPEGRTVATRLTRVLVELERQVLAVRATRTPAAAGRSAA